MKTLIMALSLALASGTAFAAPEGGPQGGAKGGVPMARMQKELGLTDAQLEEMRKIKDAGGSREELKAVLTPEQQARAAEMKAARTGDRAQAMKKHLDLSDEQVESIKEIRQAGGSREEIRAVLTPEQQEKFDAVREQHKEQGGQPANLKFGGPEG